MMNKLNESIDYENRKPTIRYIALASRVLVIASTRIEETWQAYIDAVPGYCHNMEYQEVLDRGCTLPEDVARVLFPEFSNIPYAY